MPFPEFLPTTRLRRAAAALCFGAGLSALSLLNPHASHAVAPMPKIAVPAYFWPGGYWDNLISAAGPVKIAVVNIDSGPGWAKEPAFAATFDRARAAGIELIGYTYTSYGRRPSGDVLADAKKYRDWYGITSVFLDETPEQCGSLPYYDNLYKTLHPFNGRVIINPGQNVEECYVGVADTIVNFEGHVTDYLSWNAASWVQQYPTSKFWHIVYAAQTSNLTPALNKARENHSGYIYLTDDIMPNPFDRLPDAVMWRPVVSAANDGSGLPSSSVATSSSTTRPAAVVITGPPTTRLGVRSSATLPHSDSVNTTIVHRGVGTDNEDAKIAHIDDSNASDPNASAASEATTEATSEPTSPTVSVSTAPKLTEVASTPSTTEPTSSSSATSSTTTSISVPSTATESTRNEPIVVPAPTIAITTAPPITAAPSTTAPTPPTTAPPTTTPPTTTPSVAIVIVAGPSSAAALQPAPTSSSAPPADGPATSTTTTDPATTKAVPAVPAATTGETTIETRVETPKTTTAATTPATRQRKGLAARGTKQQPRSGGTRTRKEKVAPFRRPTDNAKAAK